MVLSLLFVGAALGFTGGVVGLLSGASPLKRGIRQILIGFGAAFVTYLLGLAFGTTVASRNASNKLSQVYIAAHACVAFPVSTTA